jgi:hypothetical protein
MFPDPFINDSPLWQPYAGPPVAELGQVDHTASDLYAFLREHARTVRKPEPAPTLPRGMTLNELSPGLWCLVYPDGASGYRAIEGSREELIDLASHLATI